MEDVYSINVEKIRLGLDDEFKLPYNNIKKRFYVPDCENLFYVDIITSDAIRPNHEYMAETYVKTNEDLIEKFKKFSDKTGNCSYKDFLVLECDAIAVADKHVNGSNRDEIVFKECDVSSMKKILNEFLSIGYKVVEPENPMLRGRY